MKKKITFKKEVEFPTMIGEITEVSLDHNLKYIDEKNIEGDLLLSGKYKITEASRLEEDFNYNLPVEIVLTENIDLNTSGIEISDFYYEIEDNIMICNVELEVQGEEIKEEVEILEESRECDGDVVEKEIEIPVIEGEKEESIDNSLFMNLDEDVDSYGTFLVYIVRQNETINSIIEKYNTSIEELQKYNDINNVDIGSKLIIPYTNE